MIPKEKLAATLYEHTTNKDWEDTTPSRRRRAISITKSGLLYLAQSGILEDMRRAGLKIAPEADVDKVFAAMLRAMAEEIAEGEFEP